VIKFKSNGHIDETKLDKYEAKLFINFLLPERERHIRAEKLANISYKGFKGVIPLISVAYQRSMQDHLKDIRYIDESINYLKKKWGI
jgi:hypothetical protein